MFVPRLITRALSRNPFGRRCLCADTSSAHCPTSLTYSTISPRRPLTTANGVKTTFCGSRLQQFNASVRQVSQPRLPLSLQQRWEQQEPSKTHHSRVRAGGRKDSSATFATQRQDDLRRRRRRRFVHGCSLISRCLAAKPSGLTISNELISISRC